MTGTAIPDLQNQRPATSWLNGIAERVRRLFYHREGPLTRELVLNPGGHGLGPGRKPAGERSRSSQSRASPKEGTAVDQISHVASQVPQRG